LGRVSGVTGADEKPKLARQARDGHRTSWDEARALQIELNNGGTWFWANSLNQTGLVVSSVYIPLIGKKVCK
jgi:hypothetical protein